MALKYTAWESPEAGKPMVPVPRSYETELDIDEVELEMISSGICFSDIDALAGKYGPAYQYPLVPGHEGVGRVTKVGARVKTPAVGQVVGVGCFRGSCQSCLSCRDGNDHHCVQKVMTFAQHPNTGTFATGMRIKARAVYVIPDSISPVEAGPLMCAGVTVYSPYVTQKVRPGDSVGVIGLGGLGHLSVQIGRAWGCKVTVFSSGSAKRDLAMQLGAHDYVDTSVEGWVKTYTGTQNFIMSTASGPNLDWSGFLTVLAVGGRFVIIGLPGMAPTPIMLLQLLMGEKGIVGSGVGQSGNHTRMLQFVAQHKIRPMIEKFPFDQINEAVEKVKAGKVHFRAVVVHDKSLL